MKDMFSIYFQPTNDEMKKIWDTAIIIVDANVLLNLYKFTNDTTTTFTGIIEKLSNRFWIPHQVALEYNSNRITVINEQSDAYHRVQQTIRNATTELNAKLDKELSKYKKRHPVINQSSITARINDCIESILSELENNKKDHPNYIYDDPIRDFIVEHLGDKIGKPYNQEELDKIFKDGEERYSKKFPPGYEDLSDKSGQIKYFNELEIKSEYGDLIVWNQILNHAKDVGKPIIFVTDDAKEDWWQRSQGKTVGPRVELLNEFRHHTGNSFYMYESHRFIEFGQTYLSEQVNKNAIREVEQYNNAEAIDYKKIGKKSIKQYLSKLEQSNEEEQSIYNWLMNNSYEIIEEKLSEKIDRFSVGDYVVHKKHGVGYVEKNLKDDEDDETRYIIRFLDSDKLRIIHDSSSLISGLENNVLERL